MPRIRAMAIARRQAGPAAAVSRLMDDLRHGGPEARDRINWLQLLSLARAPDAVADRVRAEQFAAVARMTPFMIACTLLYVSGLGTVLWRAGQADWVWLWAMAQLAALAISIAVVLRVRRTGAATVAAARLRAMAVGAGVQALLINGAILHAAPDLDAGTRAFVVAAQLALTGAGAFFFASAPLAGLVHVGVYAVGLMGMNLGGTHPPALVVLLQLAFAATLARGILLHAHMLARQVRSRAALEDRGEVIAMLLNEYERHASDWLWESDAEHRLVRASQRLSDVMGRPLGEFLGQRIDAMARLDPEAVEPIQQAMAERRPFRAVHVRVLTDEGEKWLSLSGTPRSVGEAFLGYRGVGSDVTETRRSHDQIARMATLDGLTGLANRATLRGVIQAGLDAASRGRRRCALLLIDLDRFKAVNDTLGHPVGDELLREVAQRLRAEVGRQGEPARLGGDEFAVAMPPDGVEAAVAVAERIIAAVSAPYQIKGTAIRIGASVGIAYGPTDAATVGP
jgi:diguanylate cyclase (GGDEF)-like protein